MAAGSNKPAEQAHGERFDVATREGGALAARAWGERGRPVVLLVHGYPDTSRVWQDVAPALARDYFVVAYDVRGAGESFAPRGLAAYSLARLADDLVRVADAVSPQSPVHLVGHDWGSILSWEAVTDPALARRFASFTSISGPCLDHVGFWLRRRRLQSAARQARRSWYVAAFHLPLAAPLAWRLLGRYWPWLLQRLEGAPAAAEPTRAATGARGVALYRANMLARLLRPRERRSTVPVQTVIPTKDPFVSVSLADCAAPWVARRRRVEIDAGHWLPLSHGAWLAATVHEFIALAEAGEVPVAASKSEPGRTTAINLSQTTEVSP